MIAFGDWLKQLVMIVLLAVFSDLLLPTKTMQKYVRMVLGLTIIAAMIQPIVPFFKKNWADEMTKAAIAEFDAGQVGSSQSDRTTERDYAAALQNQTDSTANGLLGAQLANQLEQTLGVTPVTLTVSGAETGNQNVSVHVVLAETDASQLNNVQAFVARSLGISVQKVSVRVGGR